MTKYIAEILKLLGVDYLDYKIDNFWEESTNKNIISLLPKNKEYNPDDVITIYWEEDSCYLHIENNLEIDEYGHISVANPLFKEFSLPVFNLSLSPEDILKLWQNNKESITCFDERFGSIYTTEVPDYNYSQTSDKISLGEDPEIEEEGLSLKSKRFGRKRKN